jgi:hypothetical protein
VPRSDAELIADLRSSEVVVARAIEDLLAAGMILVEEDAGVRYRPASADQDRLTRLLAEADRVKPGAVRRLIEQSSDAFRIIKD